MPEELVEAKKLESTVKRIKDVVACKVVLSDKGEIEEVHVLSGPHRAAGLVARDVESALLAARGVKIDKHKISVAQMTKDKTLGDVGRPALKRVALAVSQEEAEVTVEIALGEAFRTGRAKGIPSPRRWLKLAAEAAIDALLGFLPPQVEIVLKDVGSIKFKSLEVAVVVLTLLEKGQQKVLSGSCPITFDERESVVKAVLDALNRKFPMLVDY